MAIDKAVDSAQLDSGLSAIADAIRAKAGTSAQLAFPAGMESAVDSIVTPGETVTYSQVNTAVKAYLDYVAAHPYESDDYTYSYIGQFTDEITNGDKPLGVTVNVQSGKLAVSDSVGGTASKTVTAGQQTIYNIAPTTDGGDYINLDANGNIVACGHLIPTGALRMINSVTRNMRDLGGWACDGGHIKYGILFRSAELNAADADLVRGWLGIKTELDLTADGTAGAISGLRYVGAGSYAMYALTPASAWKTNIRAIFDAAKYNEPLVFHCAAGADRTGTLACVIEGILGVSQSNIDADYELTSFYSERKRNGSYQGNPNQTWAKLMESIGNVSGSTFRDKCVNFIASLGFTAAEINAFRAAMIDGDPQTVTPSISTYTVTKSGNHVTFGNTATGIDQYQDYVCELKPEHGYVIDTVNVKVNGNDVTEACFTGEQTPFGTEEITQNGSFDVAWRSFVSVNVSGGVQRSVSRTLGNSHSDNSRQTVLDGHSYGEVIVPNDGYEITDITVTMGGTDISDNALTLIEEA